jgi:hypothetical protein
MQGQQQQQRGSGPGPQPQSGQRRGGGRNTRGPGESPNHYNLDLPEANDDEDRIESDLRRLEEQNDRIIQLLQQIKSGMNSY